MSCNSQIMKKKLIVYGIGKFAQYVSYLFENDSSYTVMAYCIEEKLHQNLEFDGKPLLVFENLQNQYNPTSCHIFIAVGNNKIRENIFSRCKEKGYTLASYISTQAQSWLDLKIGENVFIGEGSVVQPFVNIEDNSILIASNIGHHSRIEKHALLSVTTLGGNVTIGNNSFLGMHCVIKHSLKIGPFSLIGMNTKIENDTKAYSVYSSEGSKLRDIDSSKLLDRLLL